MERIVTIAGIPVSATTGFKNLIFETSRYAQGVATIRGFGETLDERQLNSIENMQVEFILKTDELFNLAYIYCLFRAHGALPLENKYILQKLKTTITGGKTMQTPDEIKKAKKLNIKTNVKCLLVMLQQMSIRTMEKTSNGFHVNLVFTLYKDGFTPNEYDEFIKKLEEWKLKTNFDAIVKGSISDQIHLFKDDNNPFKLRFYPSTALNAIYKDNMISSAYGSYLLNMNSTLEEKANDDEQKLTAKQDALLRNFNITKEEILNPDKNAEKIKKTINKIAHKIDIPNRNTTKLELITYNNISYIPIKGSNIMHKSLLGIGKSHMSLQMIFDEHDNDIVQSLKIISDKNIVNYKLHFDHPMLNIFDFYSGNIVNINFANLEDANGIMVSMVLEINGYRYDNESIINNADMVGEVVYGKLNRYKKIAGSYFEILANYLHTRRNILTLDQLNFAKTTIESFIDKKTEYHLNYFEAFSIYSSKLDSFGIFSIKSKRNKEHLGSDQTIDINLKSYPDITFSKNSKGLLEIVDAKNELFQNKDIYKAVDIFADLSIFAREKNIFKDLFSDAQIRFVAMLDSYVLLHLHFRNDNFYEESLKQSKVKEKFIEKWLRKGLSAELFNPFDKENNYAVEPELFINQKIIEEFYLHIPYILQNYLKNEIEEFSNPNNASLLHDLKNGYKLNDCFKLLSSITSKFCDSFIRTLQDENFIETIFLETNGYYKVAKDNGEQTLSKEYVSSVIQDFFKDFNYIYINSKTELFDKIYNIFLFRVIYYDLSFIALGDDRLYPFRLNAFGQEPEYNQVFTQLLTSCLFAPVLIKTKNRTDLFGNFIDHVYDQFGYKLNRYNYFLRNEVAGDEKRRMYFDTEVDFYDIFDESAISKMKSRNSHYLKECNRETDIAISQEPISKNLIKKDITYFFGNQIPKIDFEHSLVNDVYFSPVDGVIHGLYDFITLQKEKFIKDEQYVYLNEHLADETFKDERTDDNPVYDYPGHPLDKLGKISIPSSVIDNYIVKTEKITNNSFTDYCKFKINDIMKGRIIGNFDPFENLKTLNKTIQMTKDTLLPDYFIMVTSKVYETDALTKSKNTTTVDETRNESHIHIQLKGLTNISIVKNPKTKIKTCLFSLNYANRIYFNRSLDDGSFHIQIKENGKIRMQAIKPGDEIRIHLGYSFEDSQTVFNGVITTINENFNMIQFSCTDFTPSLYKNIYGKIESDIGFFEKISEKLFKKEMVAIKDEMSALKDIKDQTYAKIVANIKHKCSKLNFFLFYGWLKDHVFVNPNRFSFSYIADIALTRLPEIVTKNFVRNTLEDSVIQKGNFLARTANDIKNLDKAFGTSEREISDRQNFSPIIRNTFNIDEDYETYGLLHVIHDEKTMTSAPEKCETLDGTPYEFVLQNQKYTEFTEQDVKEIAKHFENIGVSPDAENIIFGSPFENKFDGYQVTSPFAIWRNSYKTPRPHTGVDLQPKVGKNIIKSDVKVLSVADGWVVTSTFSNGAGNLVTVKHSDTLRSVYMHLENRQVKVGQHVKKGDILGIMGNTGHSTGPHLHLEIRDDTAPLYKYCKFADGTDDTRHEFEKWVILNNKPHYCNPLLYINNVYYKMKQGKGKVTNLNTSKDKKDSLKKIKKIKELNSRTTFDGIDWSNIDFDKVHWLKNDDAHNRVLNNGIIQALVAESLDRGYNPAITIAQFALESNWGRKQVGENNFFGITANPSNETNYTKSMTSGLYFKVYDNPADGISSYFEHVIDKNFSGTKDKNFEEALPHLKNSKTGKQYCGTTPADMIMYLEQLKKMIKGNILAPIKRANGEK
ncbi:peptidoglycan DD-metalloendopeptidase family protein [Fusobacterium necrophorum]|uniref:Peptidoglycan DD-metalloendopeptidase family protein n=1 Tax=Fusobacterium necrophorum subsp. funduliforme TaxID=143387 RepID=A0A162J8Q8_9FUSO|nr:peptidoglycan DD-metalloendopeptidase family protein [Fusobacterium necrophorum]KYL05345.1 hypothetical protein A2J07_00995 [Fusobacterium necrophorum subsp. funduliforme]